MKTNFFHWTHRTVLHINLLWLYKMWRSIEQNKNGTEKSYSPQSIGQNRNGTVPNLLDSPFIGQNKNGTVPNLWDRTKNGTVLNHTI